MLVQLALMSQGESGVHSSMSNEIMHLSSYVLPPPLGARTDLTHAKLPISMQAQVSNSHIQPPSHDTESPYVLASFLLTVFGKVMTCVSIGIIGKTSHTLPVNDTRNCVNIMVILYTRSYPLKIRKHMGKKVFLEAMG